MPLSKCIYLDKLSEAQRKAMRKAIADDRWYMGEKAGHDVGFEAAKEDFFDNYFDSWVLEFRKNYCEGVCKLNEECEAYHGHLRRLSSTKN